MAGTFNPPDWFVECILTVSCYASSLLLAFVMAVLGVLVYSDGVCWDCSVNPVMTRRESHDNDVYDSVGCFQGWQ